MKQKKGIVSKGKNRTEATELQKENAKVNPEEDFSET